MEYYPTREKWYIAVEETVRKTIGKCYPRNWRDENHITRSLLTGLRDEHSHAVILKEKLNGKHTTCLWDVYKNTLEQDMEKKHGDIGVLVQLHFQKNSVIEGVAFLEAKRIYHSKINDSLSYFATLDNKQLERVCQNSSFHRTVFYDCIIEESKNTPIALTLPTRHLLTINRKDRYIYPYCECFSYCLTNRYFQGYELDFNPETVNSVNGIIEGNGGVDFLIVAQIILHPELKADLDFIDINHDIYTRIESIEPDSENNYVTGSKFKH